MRVAVLVPGSYPLGALAGVLAKTATDDPLPVQKTKEFEQVLKETNDAGKYDGLQRIASLVPGIWDAPLVILIDQFEEVYSLCKEPAQRHAFIKTLLHAATDPTGDVSVVITLRSDFWGETQRHEQLNQIIGSDWSINVPAMTEAELREAISAPAKQAGHPLDEAVIELLIKDSEGREGALPLLQFVLTQIWEGLREGKKPTTIYRNIKGVGGALACKAEDVYDQLTQSEQEIARRVFIGLVQLGTDIRNAKRRVRIDTLVSMENSRTEVEQVIYAFAAPGARLLSLSSLDNHETLEVTHEALFEHWQQLKNWIDASRDNLRFKRRLETASQYWLEQGKPEGLLWRSPDLNLLQEYQRRMSEDMNKVESSFYKASEQSELRRRKNRRLITGSFALGFVLTSLSTGIALWKVRESNQRRIQAELNSVRVLEQSAATLKASGEVFDALRISMQVAATLLNRQKSNTSGINGVGTKTALLLRETIADAKESNRFFHSDRLLRTSFSPDGKILAVASSNGLYLWNLDGSLIKKIEEHSDSVYDAAFSPDGETVASVGQDGYIRLWNRDGSPLRSIKARSDSLTSVAFSPDGKTLASGSFDGIIHLWDKYGELLRTIDSRSGVVYTIDFSPDGESIISGSSDKQFFWNRDDGALVKTLEDKRFLGWSSDGEISAIVNSEGTVTLFNRNREPLKSLSGFSDNVSTFSSNGKYIATLSRDGIVTIWDIDEGVSMVLDRSRGRGGTLSFSPDSKTFVFGDYDNHVRLWNLSEINVDSPKDRRTHFLDNTVFHDNLGIDILAVSEDWIDSALIGKIRLWSFPDNFLGQIPHYSQDDHQFDFVATADNTIVAIGNRSSSGDDDYPYIWSSNGKIFDDAQEFLAQAIVQKEDYIIALSPDGSTIGMIDRNWSYPKEDKQIILWSSNQSFPDLISQNFPSYIPISPQGIDFSGDSKTLIVTSLNYIDFWNTKGKLLSRLNTDDIHQSRYLSDFTASVDGKIFATSSYWYDTDKNPSIQLWSRKGKPLSTIDALATSMAFSPDKKTLITRGDAFDHTLKVWTLLGEHLATLVHATPSILDFSLSSNHETIATIDLYGQVYLWNVNGEHLGILKSEKSIEHIVFNQKGSVLFGVSEDGSIYSWNLDLHDLALSGCRQLQDYLTHNLLGQKEIEIRQLCDIK